MPSGRTPTLDSAHEPAAASFDTDDEAAGRPTPAAAVEQAMAHEGRAPAETPGNAKAGVSAAVWLVLAVAAAAVLAWALLR